MPNSTEKRAPRRGRPRSFDPDVALGRASERFRAQGYSATSLDDLVDATGLKRPSLYAAFGDKRALYLAALARTRAWIEAAFDELEAAALAPEPLMRSVLYRMIDGFLRGEAGPAGCLVINTATAEAVTDPEIRAALAEILAREDRRFEEVLAAAGAKAPGAQGRMLASLVHSLSVRARAGASREAMRALAEDGIALLLGGDAPR